MIFIEIDEGAKLKGLNIIFQKVFSKNEEFDMNLQNNLSIEYIKHCSQTVHFGWKKKLYQLAKLKNR